MVNHGDDMLAVARNHDDMLVMEDGTVRTLGEVKALLRQHELIVGKLMNEVQQETVTERIRHAHCPSCMKPVMRGVTRWHVADVGRKVWFEDYPEDGEKPFVDRGDVLYFDYRQTPHFYTCNECGERLGSPAQDLIDALVDRWWLPEDVPFDMEDQ